MPLIDRSTYIAPRWLRHGHLQTIYPILLRPKPQLEYKRQRIDTLDGDFLDLDWSCVGSRRTGLIVHGLESSAQETGIRAMAKALNRRGWDAVVLNLRGCSGQPNRLPRAYHASCTDDLAMAIEAVMASDRYDHLGLIGFSLGGNLILKYLGEKSSPLSSKICGAAAVSVPCDLTSCAKRIMEPANRLYMFRMIRSLKRKLRAKQVHNDPIFQKMSLYRIRTIADFDEQITAPLHGFADANEYWSRSSCKPLLGDISVPTLLINAQDDPLLPPSCFPTEAAQHSKQLTLETPRWGGHVGFVQFGLDGEYWHEQRVASFLATTLP